LIIKLNSNGLDIFKLRGEGYDVVWYEGIQEYVSYGVIGSPHSELFIMDKGHLI
jgi:hypothetical protein